MFLSSKTKFTVIPGVPAAVGPVDIEVVTPPDLAEEPAVSAAEPSIDVGDRSSVAAEVREIAPGVPLPKLPESTVQARAEAVSIGHRMSHLPNIRCATFATVSSSFPRGSKVTGLRILNLIFLTQRSLGSKLQLVT